MLNMKNGLGKLVQNWQVNYLSLQSIVLKHNLVHD